MHRDVSQYSKEPLTLGLSHVQKHAVEEEHL